MRIFRLIFLPAVKWPAGLPESKKRPETGRLTYHHSGSALRFILSAAFRRKHSEHPAPFHLGHTFSTPTSRAAQQTSEQ